MQQLTSPSSYSINQHALRLNSSSGCMISPSQSNFGSSLKNNIVNFEEFGCGKQMAAQPEPMERKSIAPVAASFGLGKKKLTIQIDESYGSAQDNVEVVKIEKVHAGDRIRPKTLHQLDEQSSRDIDGLEIISPIENNSIFKYQELIKSHKELQDKIESYELLLKHQQSESAAKQEKIRELEERVQYYQAQAKAKNVEAQNTMSRLEYLQEKLKQKQLQCIKMKQQLNEKNLRASQQEVPQQAFSQLEQKVRQKDSKMKELVKINQKLKNLNKELIREVKVSEKKVRDLQKQMQNNLCHATQQNIHRLKQSSLKLKEKQNLQRNNGAHSHSNNHTTKQQRQSLQAIYGVNTNRCQKQKQLSFGGTSGISINQVGRKSLERKKNPQGSTNSTGLLMPTKKATKMTGSSSNTILSKKLMHK